MEGAWGVVAELQVDEAAWAEAGARQMQVAAAGAQNKIGEGQRIKLKRQVGTHMERTLPVAPRDLEFLGKAVKGP